jgi:antirestriction protein ArdC
VGTTVAALLEGNDSYVMGELVDELGAAFLCAKLGISPQDL